MDSIIPIGQKITLAEYMILSTADNRPPMLDKDLYDSWKSIMELYMQNREHGRMILESVEHGLLIWPTIEENGVTRTKKYAELSVTEKIQADYPGITEGPVTQSVITHNADYQADDLDAYDSDCDEISTAKAILMANFSSYGSDVLFEVPISDNTNNDMLNQSVQEMTYSEPSHLLIEQYTGTEWHGIEDALKSCPFSYDSDVVHEVIPQISFRCYIVKMGVLQIGISAMVIENKVVIRTMYSPNHSTSDLKDAFSSMNILNYTSVSSDYFSASSESSSFNSSKNSNDNMISPVFSSFYNNTYLKDVQAFYAKELPISSPDPITPPAILTPSPVLPPSLLFDP
ncbi:hypothetical protein Tco_0111247 [Tanacetum coccineum]